jgi:hypothetical protein
MQSFAAEQPSSDIGHLENISVGETGPDPAIVSALREGRFVSEQFPVRNGRTIQIFIGSSSFDTVQV